MALPCSPQPASDWALFLDVDGTLLDIAERPERVVVPENLIETLAGAAGRLSGAVALVSGRMLEDIDRLFAPLRLCCAAEHGAVLRLADGAVRMHASDRAVPNALRARLRNMAEHWRGVLVEEKRFTVVLHYRQAPSFAQDAATAARMIAAEAGHGWASSRRYAMAWTSWRRNISPHRTRKIRACCCCRVRQNAPRATGGAPAQSDRRRLLRNFPGSAAGDTGVAYGSLNCCQTALRVAVVRTRSAGR